MTSNSTRKLVIGLHGVGSNGANLAPLGSFLRQSSPDMDFESPDAPFSFGNGAGRQWFSIEGVTEANRPQRVVEARAAFDEVLGDIIARHALTNNLDRVALVGFSQGSIMALDAVASGRWPVAAVVAFSGRLASPEPYAPSETTRLSLIHGTADHIMPFAESEKAKAALTKAGVSAELHTLPGVGHTISQDGAAIAANFLLTAFGGKG
jgi:phospholipase/carboxylesterase